MQSGKLHSGRSLEMPSEKQGSRSRNVLLEGKAFWSGRKLLCFCARLGRGGGALWERNILLCSPRHVKQWWRDAPLVDGDGDGDGASDDSVCAASFTHQLVHVKVWNMLLCFFPKCPCGKSMWCDCFSFGRLRWQKDPYLFLLGTTTELLHLALFYLCI